MYRDYDYLYRTGWAASSSPPPPPPSFSSLFPPLFRLLSYLSNPRRFGIVRCFQNKTEGCLTKDSAKCKTGCAPRSIGVKTRRATTPGTGRMFPQRRSKSKSLVLFTDGPPGLRAKSKFYYNHATCPAQKPARYWQLRKKSYLRPHLVTSTRNHL